MHLTSRFRRQRLIALSLVAGALALAWAIFVNTSPSSARTKSSSSQAVTISVWDQNTVGGLNPIYAGLVSLFEKQNPNIKVHRIATGFTQILQQQKLALSGSNPPDVVQSNDGYGVLNPEVQARLVSPLSQYANQYKWAQCQPSTIVADNRVTTNGKTMGEGTVYGWSDILGGPVGLYYNKAILRHAGVKLPLRTLADFQNALAKVKAAGQVPIQYGALEKWPGIHELEILLTAYAPNADALNRYIYGTGPATLNTPWAVKAATTLENWVKAGYFESGFNGVSYENGVTNFAKGKGAFLVSGPWVNSQITSSMGDNAGVMLMPPATAGRAPIAVNAGGNPYVIAAHSAHQAQAAAYLNFITCSKTAADYFLAHGQIPIYLPSNWHKYVKPNSSAAAWITAWNEVLKDNGSVNYIDLSTLDGTNFIGQTVQEMTGNQISPQQAISAIEGDYSKFRHSGAA
jgi:raffinose/stachyose/melibiose transport system substrate-binding protein